MEKNYDLVLDNIPDGILVMDLQKHITFINIAANKLLGVNPGTVVGRICGSVCKFASCRNNCLLERTLQTGENINNYETEILTPEGNLIAVSINNSLLFDSSGKPSGSVHVMRDISQVKFLTEKIEEKYSFNNIVAKNYKMKEIFEILPAVAQTKTTVLIEGESGTGKELIAEAIHYNSPRKGGAFVKVNCGALADGILESELFGHVKGAFTGAINNKIGRFELANNGTIFLDEVGDMSQNLQVKVLRILQNEEFEKVGSSKSQRIDVRVIAATNRNLEELIKKGEFREDLYFRLSVVPIMLPPLRERRDDVPLLIKHFMSKLNKKLSRNVNNISPKAMEFLMNYEYPGNVRELENILEHCIVVCRDNTILIEHFPKKLFNISSDPLEKALASDDPMRIVEKDVITRMLKQSNWRYQEVAKKLNISRTSLWRKMKTLDIRKP